jgi:hypothetical protein
MGKEGGKGSQREGRSGGIFLSSFLLSLSTTKNNEVENSNGT